MLKKFFLFLFLLILMIVGTGYYLWQYKLNATLPVKNEFYYTIKPKATLSHIAIELMDRKILDYPTALTWVWLARIEGKANKIKAGEYIVPPQTTPQTLLQLFISGKTRQHTLTLLEGWHFRQVLQAVRKSPYLTHTITYLDNDAIMEKLGVPEQHPEGRFYPDTYHVAKGMTDIAFLKRAYKMMEKVLHEEWTQRGDNSPVKTPYEALILASLIEKETGKVEERADIAGVFARRLKIDMMLQTDPTVIYALGEKFDGDIRKKDLSINSPYNTYVNKGLPPTPIAMPSRDAIHAALHPAEGDTLFFVAKGDGGHYFSKTNEEHECAVIEYLLKDKVPRRYRQQCQRYPSCAACR